MVRHQAYLPDVLGDCEGTLTITLTLTLTLTLGYDERQYYLSILRTGKGWTVGWEADGNLNDNLFMTLTLTLTMTN